MSVTIIHSEPGSSSFTSHPVDDTIVFANNGAALVGRRILYVDSIDDLVELNVSGLISGQQAGVGGYYQSGDGGGGQFYWDGVSTEEPDGGIVFQPTGADVGRWIRLGLGKIVNPRIAGAKLDGEFDDGPAIRLLIDEGFSIDLAGGHAFINSGHIRVALPNRGIDGNGGTLELGPGSEHPGLHFSAAPHANLSNLDNTPPQGDWNESWSPDSYTFAGGERAQRQFFRNTTLITHNSWAPFRVTESDWMTIENVTVMPTTSEIAMPTGVRLHLCGFPKIHNLTLLNMHATTFGLFLEGIYGADIRSVRVVGAQSYAWEGKGLIACHIDGVFLDVRDSPETARAARLVHYGSKLCDIRNVNAIGGDVYLNGGRNFAYGYGHTITNLNVVDGALWLLHIRDTTLDTVQVKNSDGRALVMFRSDTLVDSTMGEADPTLDKDPTDANQNSAWYTYDKIYDIKEDLGTHWRYYSFLPDPAVLNCKITNFYFEGTSASIVATNSPVDPTDALDATGHYKQFNGTEGSLKGAEREWDAVKAHAPFYPLSIKNVLFENGTFTTSATSNITNFQSAPIVLHNVTFRNVTFQSGGHLIQMDMVGCAFDNVTLKPSGTSPCFRSAVCIETEICNTRTRGFRRAFFNLRTNIQTGSPPKDGLYSLKIVGNEIDAGGLSYTTAIHYSTGWAANASIIEKPFIDGNNIRNTSTAETSVNMHTDDDGDDRQFVGQNRYNGNLSSELSE